MRSVLPKFFVLPCLAFCLGLWSCDKDLISTEDQPTVDYVLVVSDSLTAAPLENVKVRVTTIAGDTSTYYTDRLQGRVELGTVASSRTLFILSKPGYRTLDLLDTVDAKPDTVFNRPVQRLLRIKLANLNPDSGRTQVRVLLRDAELKKILGGVVILTDSLGGDRPFGDNDSDGAVDLYGLKVGKNPIRVEHPDYLGLRAEVPYEKGQDSGAGVRALTLRLTPMDNSISGLVYYKTASSSLPLRDGRVEFRLKDTLALPSKFIAYTSSKVEDNGRFLFPKVPAMEGELWFFKNRTATERSRMIPLTREEVLLDGPIPLVTLTITADSLLPLLTAGPKAAGLPGKDSLDSRDSLVFRFNQEVGEVKALAVKLINGSELLIQTAWYDSNKVLVIKQKDAGWVEGKKYEYRLQLVNSLGETFTIPGDSSKAIQGTFDVRTRGGVIDTNIAYPRDIRLAYFNSGNHYQFGPADTNTSAKGDSSSEFVRLKWKWDAKPTRADSLVVYFQDNLSNRSWTRWGSLPGFLDSAYLAFSDHYSTLQVPSQKSRFPLRDSGRVLQFRVLPKHAGRIVDTEDNLLTPIAQEMGPSVYAHYGVEPGGTLGDTAKIKDTVYVTFRLRISDINSAVDWGSSPPIPKVFDDANGVKTVEWAWHPTDRKVGLLIYTMPDVVTKSPQLRVDMEGQSFLSKPIWQRNRNDKLEIRK